MPLQTPPPSTIKNSLVDRVSMGQGSASRSRQLKIKKHSASTVFFACLISALVAIDLSARLIYPYLHVDAFASGNRSYIWWAAHSFKEEKTAPEIVMLGSSLVMAAGLAGDATHYDKIVYMQRHHRAEYLQELLSKKSGRKENVFSFAIGGQMASDAYAITRTLLTGKHAPRTLIYGIAPRDLMDNCFEGLPSSETFKYLERAGALKNVSWSARRSIWEKADYLLGQLCFIYGHRADFLYLQNQITKTIISQGLHYKDLDQTHTPIELRRIALMDLPEDVAINENAIGSAHKELEPYRDNLGEYASRYRKFNQKMFAEQLDYLDKLLKTCSERNINVELVNMPLTASNMKLMPPGFYEKYMNAVNALAQQNHAHLIDMNDSSHFQQKDFADSVHLNGFGAEKFFQLVSKRLVEANPDI